MGLGDSGLDNFAGAVFNAGGPTKIRGNIQSATNTGAGTWQIDFTQDMPEGEYICGAQILSTIGKATWTIQATNNTRKILSLWVDGVLTSLPFSVWFARAFNN